MPAPGRRLSALCWTERKKFGPLAMGVKVIPVGGPPDLGNTMRAEDCRWAYGCIEAMSFDIREAHVPHSGFVTCDPLDQKEVLLLDGRLEGELNRIGVPVQAKNFEWNTAYTVSGN